MISPLNSSIHLRNTTYPELMALTSAGPSAGEHALPNPPASSACLAVSAKLPCAALPAPAIGLSYTNVVGKAPVSHGEHNGAKHLASTVDTHALWQAG